VDTAIEGSLRRQQDLLRIHVQLVNVQNGCHIWTEKYERRFTDVFQLQEEIAAAIVAALKMELPRQACGIAADYQPGSPHAISEGPVLVAPLKPGVTAQSGDLFPREPDYTSVESPCRTSAA
jgi:hypothetical protein